MNPDDAIAFRQAWAGLADAVIGGGPWCRLFRAVGWEPGQWPSQSQKTDR